MPTISLSSFSWVAVLLIGCGGTTTIETPEGAGGGGGSSAEGGGGAAPAGQPLSASLEDVRVGIHSEGTTTIEVAATIRLDNFEGILSKSASVVSQTVTLELAGEEQVYGAPIDQPGSFVAAGDIVTYEYVGTQLLEPGSPDPLQLCSQGPDAKVTLSFDVPGQGSIEAEAAVSEPIECTCC